MFHRYQNIPDNTYTHRGMVSLHGILTLPVIVNDPKPIDKDQSAIVDALPVIVNDPRQIDNETKLKNQSVKWQENCV